MEKTIQYQLTPDGAFPEETTLAGVQGEHRATAITFTPDERLTAKINELKKQGKTIFAEIKAVTIAGERVEETTRSGEELFLPLYLSGKVTSSGLDVIIIFKLVIAEDQREICKAQIKLCFTPAPVYCDFENDEKSEVEELCEKAEEITSQLQDKAEAIQKTMDQKLKEVKNAAELSSAQLKMVKEVAKEAQETRTALETGMDFVFVGGDAFSDTEKMFVVDTALSESSNNPISNKAVAEAVNKLSADYIVEQGKSDKWYFRKWQNGDAECWATIDTTITTTENNEAGIALYLGSSETWSFPTNIFKVSPACTYDTYAAGYPMTVIHTLTKDEVRLRYLTKWAVSGNAKVSIIAKGRWK